MTTRPESFRDQPRLAPRGLRGVALVDHVIGEVTAGRIRLWQAVAPGRAEPREPCPLAANQLERLTLSGGRPLPPSLARWLGFDAATYPEMIGDAALPALHPATVPTLVPSPFDEDAKQAVQDFLRADSYRIASGSDSVWALYAGVPDALGEYPVFELRIDDTPLLALDAPGFDVWLASNMRVLDKEGKTDLFDVPSYAAAMQEQARLNLAGHRVLDLMGFTTYDAEGIPH